MNIDIVKRIALFSELPDDEIRHLITSLRLTEQPPGAMIMLEGDESPSCFILVDGVVEIIKAFGTPDERILAVRPEGELLGEMSLFTRGGKHTASVRALTPLKLLEITKTDLDNLIRRQPEVAYHMVDMLSRRLEESENVTIQDLREKNRQLTLAYRELQEAQAQMIIKERLEQELEIARHIQNSLLLHKLPQTQEYSLGALMIPARAVGGDFYDFVPLSDGKWGIIIGDVSDKGTPAALFMALTFSLLRATAIRCNQPAETLQEVNSLLNGMNTSGMFVTLIYACFDPDTGEFNFARAGHPYPVVINAKGEQLPLAKKTGQPLGIFDEPLLDMQIFTLDPGGSVLMYSDGLSEAENELGEVYDENQVIRLVNQQPAQNAQSLCERIWTDVQEFCGGAPQQDDFTIVALKRRAF